MRVVTWNMGCATNRYCSARDDAWRLLLALHPDVVFVQEAMIDVPTWLGDYGSLFIRPAYPGQGWGSAVLVRGLTAVERPISIAGSFVTAAEVDLGGAAVLLASIHVCPGPRLAKNVATLGAALAPLLRDRPFIVGGDLNSSRHFDAVYKRKTHRSFLSQMGACGAHDCSFALHGREIRTYWGNSHEEYQVDHLFVDAEAGTRVRGCTVLTTAETRTLSDHSPVVLDLA